MLLDLRPDFSKNLLFLSFLENPDGFVVHFATLFFSANLVRAGVSPFLSGRKMIELATNFLQER